MKRIKIFPAEKIKQIDRLTIERQNITSADLMERAVERLLPYVLREINTKQKILIYAGVGNNGGDGLVLARKLVEKGFDVKVLIVRFSDKVSEDFSINYHKLTGLGVSVSDFRGNERINADVIIDAIFGVGLNRPAAGISALAIDQINSMGVSVLSIDMPSGLFADFPNKAEHAIIRASKVYTFQFPKLSFFFKENSGYVPTFEIIDIGLDKEVIDQTETDKFFLIKPEKMPMRKPFASKWDFGHVLVIGGSLGKAGSVGFAAAGAYYAGAGWTSVYVPKNIISPIQSAFPEIMCIQGKGKNFLKKIELQDSRFAVAIGPGLGTEKQTVSAFEEFIVNYESPLVLDADALNILANNKKLLDDLPAGSVLTPHKFEFQRLNSKWEDGLDKIQKAKNFSEKYQSVLVLKGQYTLITDGKEVYFNSTGNPALAKAGSGDVLTGLIAGFLAQGGCSMKAALQAVWLHGKAADEWVRKYDEKVFSPIDLIQELKKLHF